MPECSSQNPTGQDETSAILENMTPQDNRPLIPSDALSIVRRLSNANSAFAPLFGSIAQYEVVVDSNVVISDLIFLAKHRKKLGARTALQEAIASTVLIPLVPSTLPQEVEERLPSLAEEEGIDHDRLKELWAEYSTALQLLRVNEKPHSPDIVDPDDIPFVELFKERNAIAVLSRDHHISAMGARRVDPLKAAIPARDYARAAANVQVPRLVSAFGLLVVSKLVGAVWGRLSSRRGAVILFVFLLALGGVVVFLNWERIKKWCSKILESDELGRVLDVAQKASRAWNEQRRLAEVAAGNLDASLRVLP